MSSQKPFDGFKRPYYTQIPNELFDELMAELSSAELRVLLYIMRRTFGFQRDSDAISINQFVDGITKHNGEVLDRGCGVSRSAATRALKSLEDKGYVLAQRQSSKIAGNQPTIYSLRFADDGAVYQKSTPLVSSEAQGGPTNGIGVVSSEAQGSPKTGTPLVPPVHPQKIDLQNTSKKEMASTTKQTDLPMWQRLDPVTDRDAILRNRIDRPELPPPTANMPVKTIEAWVKIQREWDAKNRR